MSDEGTSWNENPWAETAEFAETGKFGFSVPLSVELKIWQGADNPDNGPSYRDKLIWSNQQQALPPMYQNKQFAQNQPQWRSAPAQLPPSIPFEVCEKLEQLPLQKQMMIQEIVNALSLA